jgi:AAA domain
MRVAVSGTHCCGKSTLIDAFLLDHPDFTHEPEPYVVLQEEYGEIFGGEPSLDDFYRQLEFNVDRLRLYSFGDRVIYERSPVDFLAYMMAPNDLRRDRESARLVETSLAIVRDAIHLIDLIVFLPLEDDDAARFTVSDSEDPELRKEVDTRLVGILRDDDFNLFSAPSPVILEARGSTAERLRTLEGFL